MDSSAHNHRHSPHEDRQDRPVDLVADHAALLVCHVDDIVAQRVERLVVWLAQVMVGLGGMLLLDVDVVDTVLVVRRGCGCELMSAGVCTATYSCHDGPEMMGSQLHPMFELLIKTDAVAGQDRGTCGAASHGCCIVGNTWDSEDVGLAPSVSHITASRPKSGRWEHRPSRKVDDSVPSPRHTRSVVPEGERPRAARCT